MLLSSDLGLLLIGARGWVVGQKLKFFITSILIGLAVASVYLANKTAIPSGDYIAITVYGFGCGNNVLLNLDTGELGVYVGEYNYLDLSHKRKIS